MLNLPSYSSVVGLNPFMPESSMRRLIYPCQLGRRRLRSATPRNSHMQRTQSYPIFPRERNEPLAVMVGDVVKFLHTLANTSSTRQPSDQAARILTPRMINSNRREISTFYLILLASSSSSSCVSPRALRENSRKNPSSNLHQSHPILTPCLEAALLHQWRRRAKPRRSRRAPSSCLQRA